MFYETLRKCGELGIEFGDIEGPGSLVARDFMKELLRHIVKRSTQFYDEANEHVFNYKERQMHSIVCPSIADITPSFLIEHPLRRKPTGEPEYRGNVDYWIHYRGYSFLMELKHTFFAYRKSRKPRKAVRRKFLQALKQLREIRKRESRNLAIDKGLIKIALEVVVFYSASKDPEKLQNDMEEIDPDEIFHEMVENLDLSNKLNLLALWVLNERMVEPVELPLTFEVYPAVAFLVHISEIID